MAESKVSDQTSHKCLSTHITTRWPSIVVHPRARRLSWALRCAALRCPALRKAARPPATASCCLLSLEPDTAPQPELLQLG
jgi:hypothetical protein